MAVNIGNSLSERISRWEVLLDNLRPTMEEMPHVVPDVTELEQMHRDAKALFSRQEDLRAQARETRRQLVELAARGDRIRSRMGANLQARHGFTSDLLVKYGFKPRRVPRRRPRSETPPPPTPAPQ